MTSQAVCSVLSASQLLSPLSTTAKILFFKPTEAELCCFLSCPKPKFQCLTTPKSAFQEMTLWAICTEIIKRNLTSPRWTNLSYVAKLFWSQGRDPENINTPFFLPRWFRCWFGASAYSGTSCCIHLNWTWIRPWSPRWALTRKLSMAEIRSG